MNANAIAWIKALRSGKYKQGKAVLCWKPKWFKFWQRKTYCCLGVACELAYKAGVIGKRRGGTSSDSFAASSMVTSGQQTIRYGNTMTSETRLPPEVSQWLGMQSDYGNISGPHISLINANDVSKLTFEQIADLIEQHEAELFVAA